MSMFLSWRVITINEFLGSELLLTEIDIWSAGVVQDLVVTLNLYLITLLKGV